MIRIQRFFCEEDMTTIAWKNRKTRYLLVYEWLYSKLKKSKIKKAYSPLFWSYQFRSSETSYFWPIYSFSCVYSRHFSRISMVSFSLFWWSCDVRFCLFFLYGLHWLWTATLINRNTIFSSFTCQKRAYTCSCPISSLGHSSCSLYWFTRSCFTFSPLYDFRRVLSVCSRAWSGQWFPHGFECNTLYFGISIFSFQKYQRTINRDAVPRSPRSWSYGRLSLYPLPG